MTVNTKVPISTSPMGIVTNIEVPHAALSSAVAQMECALVCITAFLRANPTSSEANAALLHAESAVRRLRSESNGQLPEKELVIPEFKPIFHLRPMTDADVVQIRRSLPFTVGKPFAYTIAFARAVENHLRG